MSEHYPRVRLYAPSGHLSLRDSISISFHMREPHVAIARQLAQSLECYLTATGARLQRCIHHDRHSYSWIPVDEAAWSSIRRELAEGDGGYLDLEDESFEERRYGIEYRGRPLKSEYFPEMDSALRVWLPTEYLDAHGPRHLHDFALELLGSFPTCSGNVGLAFHGDLEAALQPSSLSELAFRYPGVAIAEPLGGHNLDHPTRLQSISWMTFLGQPALGEVGGVAGLRARLRSPETTIEELPGDRAVITLGEWPDSGDTHEGRLLPSYRELTQVLEPILYREEREHWQAPFDTPQELRRWQRRFLD